MYIEIQATTCIHPEQFARALRAEIREIEPDVDVRVRAVLAPRERRFQAIQSDGPAYISELMFDVIEAVRDEFESAAVIAEGLTQPVEAQEIVTLEWFAEHADHLPEPWRVTGEFVDGKRVMILHTYLDPAAVSS